MLHRGLEKIQITSIYMDENISEKKKKHSYFLLIKVGHGLKKIKINKKGK